MLSTRRHVKHYPIFYCLQFAQTILHFGTSVMTKSANTIHIYFIMSFKHHSRHLSTLRRSARANNLAQFVNHPAPITIEECSQVQCLSRIPTFPRLLFASLFLCCTLASCTLADGQLQQQRQKTRLFVSFAPDKN